MDKQSTQEKNNDNHDEIEKDDHTTKHSLEFKLHFYTTLIKELETTIQHQQEELEVIYFLRLKL